MEKNKIKDILERGVERAIDKDNLSKSLKKGNPLRIKLGVDPTGPKIHIGRAIQLWKLRAFQELGHKVVLIVGDFTAQIGDASDKQSIRKPLTLEEIKENIKGYKEQIGKIVDIEKAEIHYNSTWLKKLKPKELVSLSMNFTAQQMIQRRNFKERWDNNKPIGMHELYYPIFQGYDSFAVKSDLEIGGYDQLFNLMAGRKIQEILGQKPQDIMVSKMLNGLDGRKMSTSWGNIIRITDSPREMYGKIMSMKDEFIYEYFELCTKYSSLRLEEVKELIKENPMKTKTLLAKEIVSLYYDKEKAKEEEKEFVRVFAHKEPPSEIREIKLRDKKSLQELLQEIGFASSKKEARRLILQGAVKINNTKENNWNKEVSKGMIIQSGKRNFVKLI